MTTTVNHSPLFGVSAELSHLGDELRYFHSNRAELAARIEALRAEVTDLKSRAKFLRLQADTDPDRIARQADELEADTADAARAVSCVRFNLLQEVCNGNA